MIELPIWAFVTLLILASIGMVLLLAIFVAVAWGSEDLDTLP